MASSIGVKPYLVVIGNKGVGKSHLLNQLFEVQLDAGKSSSHVTKEQKKPVDKETEHFAGFVDTVGFDLNPKNFVLIDKSLRGKYVVFLFLTNDLRIDTSLKSLSAKLDCKPSNIWVSNCYCYSETHPQYMDEVMQYSVCVEAFKSGTLASKKIFIKEPTLSTLPSNRAAAECVTSMSAPLSKAEKKNHNAEKIKAQLKYCHAGVFHHINMHFLEISFKKEFQELNHTSVKDNRGCGDKLLGLLLERLVADEGTSLEASHMQQIEDNKFLKLYFFDVMGKSDGDLLINKIYPTSGPSNPVEDEKVGDIVEALLHITHSARLFDDIVSFFDKQD